MRRLPIPPPLPRFEDEDDDSDLQPTTVAPWRTAVALARFDEPPKSSDRESGIRALLESALSVDVDFEPEERETYDAGSTLTLVRPEPVAKTTYSLIGNRTGEIVELAPRLEKQTVPEREDEALGALVAVYEDRPTSLPPPAPEPPPAPKPIPRSQIATVRKKTTRVPRTQVALEILRPLVVDVVERWLALDLRYRLAILLAWTATCSAITALLVR